MQTEIQQLRWQCRRGMLELDLMLGTFLEKAYESLQAAEQADFIRLLGVSDQTLYEWFIGQTSPEASLQGMVAKIRHTLAGA